MVKCKFLGQVLAALNQQKAATNKESGALYKAAQKHETFHGLSRVYRAFDDAGEKRPPESKRVEQTAQQIIQGLAATVQPLIDLQFTRDKTNAVAVADIVVGNTVLARAVPVTFLLTLEKDLTDFRTAVAALPVLDATTDWTLNEATKLFVSQSVVALSTKKLQRPIVLYDATDKHPAQTQLITEDVAVGEWTTQHLSGALPEDAKAAMLSRCDTLLAAVKIAREQANTTAAVAGQIAYLVLEYLLS